MEPINFFQSVSYLDPHCPKCNSKVEYGITTHWADNVNGHVCNTCNKEL